MTIRLVGLKLSSFSLSGHNASMTDVCDTCLALVTCCDSSNLTINKEKASWELQRTKDERSHLPWHQKDQLQPKHSNLHHIAGYSNLLLWLCVIRFA
jgi:hypothetical protein